MPEIVLIIAMMAASCHQDDSAIYEVCSARVCVHQLSTITRSFDRRAVAY